MQDRWPWFYELNKDLTETKDLAPQQITLADGLQKQLLAQLKDVEAETRENAGKKRK